MGEKKKSNAAYLVLMQRISGYNAWKSLFYSVFALSGNAD